MKRSIGSILVALTVLIATPATAQSRDADEIRDVSIGYALSHYLETGGENMPLGFYVSLSSRGSPLGYDVDLAYHHGTGDLDGLHVGTLTVGPRLQIGAGGTRPFLHVLGGLRYAEAGGASDLSLGVMGGGGVDMPVGDGLDLRLGADFQIFFKDGDNLKSLRLVAGITF